MTITTNKINNYMAALIITVMIACSIIAFLTGYLVGRMPTNTLPCNEISLHDLKKGVSIKSGGITITPLLHEGQKSVITITPLADEEILSQ